MLALASTTPALKSLYVLSQVLTDRYPGTPIIYGGPFASIETQAPIFFDLLQATAIVRGEGEEVFPLLVDVLHKGDMGKPLNGVLWNANETTPLALVQDINVLPLPARHLLENHRYRPSLRRNVFDGPITAIYLSRGCPYHCAFCVSPLLRGNRLVRRRNSNLFAEMQECVERFGITGFIFYDDCLFLKSSRLNDQVQEFCRSLRVEAGEVKWEMDLRCDTVAALSPETLRALYASGCMQINMGIEKASDQLLRDLNKRLTTDVIVAACRNVKSVVPDLRLAGTFIIGGPNETETDVEKTIAFAKSLDLDFAHFSPLEVYPGTTFFKQLYDDQRATEWAYRILEDDRNYYGTILYETEHLSGSSFLELTRRAYHEFYHRPQWLERFAATTSPEVWPTAIQVIEQWSEDRFRLQHPSDSSPGKC